MFDEATTLFESQAKFFEVIKEMVDDEEITLDGDEAIGFETLLEWYRAMSSRFREITETTAPKEGRHRSIQARTTWCFPGTQTPTEKD